MKKYNIIAVSVFTMLLTACDGSSESETSIPTPPQTKEINISTPEEFNEKVVQKGIIESNELVTVTLPENQQTLVLSDNLVVKGDLVIK